MLIFLLNAWLIGIAVAAPVGPIGLLCIRKTLELGLLGALAVGLGAALADGIYGLIVAAGLDMVTRLLVEQLYWIKIIGGIFLLYLAYTDIKNAHMPIAQQLMKTDDFLRLVSKVFFLTLTNPMTMLTFIAIFASICGTSPSFTELLAMVFGVVFGVVLLAIYQYFGLAQTAFEMWYEWCVSAFTIFLQVLFFTRLVSYMKRVAADRI